MASIDIQNVEKYVRNLFKEKMPDYLSYHDLAHTRYVVQQAKRIAEETGLSPRELEIVLAAAWFHDCGYLVTALDHEKESQSIAQQFLASEGVEDKLIRRVIQCIQATRMPQNPGEDQPARVLCDADMSYLSEDFYFERTALLRKEWNAVQEEKISRKVYWEMTVEMFREHTYFTEFGQHEFSPGKEKNLQKIQDILAETGEKSRKKMKKLKSENEKLARKLDKEKLPARGVESMFRLTARNQINLSSIADNKANILISINSIVLTVLVSVGAGKIADYPEITLPGVVFIATCLSTMVFAILSTRPKISSGKFTKEDIYQKKVNLLFFGSFYKMDAEEYEWAVKEMMKDSNYLYSSMIRDQYSLGKVIGKKYMLLRIAYTVFMIGIILSVVLFAVFVVAIPS